jgi:hypothetical protein
MSDRLSSGLRAAMAGRTSANSVEALSSSSTAWSSGVLEVHLFLIRLIIKVLIADTGSFSKDFTLQLKSVIAFGTSPRAKAGMPLLQMFSDCVAKQNNFS